MRCEYSELLPGECAHCKGIAYGDWETPVKVKVVEP